MVCRSDTSRRWKGGTKKGGGESVCIEGSLNEWNCRQDDEKGEERREEKRAKVEDETEDG